MEWTTGEGREGEGGEERGGEGRGGEERRGEGRGREERRGEERREKERRGEERGGEGRRKEKMRGEGRGGVGGVARSGAWRAEACSVRQHSPPVDHSLVADMLDFCREQAKRGPAEAEKALTERVLHTSHLRVLYNLEVRRGGEGRGEEGRGGRGERRGGEGRGGEGRGGGYSEEGEEREGRRVRREGVARGVGAGGR